MLSPTQLLCTNYSRSLVELARSSIFVVFKRKPFWEASFGEISVRKLNLAGWSPLVWNIGKLPITPGLFRARILPRGKIIIAPESAICNEGLPPPCSQPLRNAKHKTQNARKKEYHAKLSFEKNRTRNETMTIITINYKLKLWNTVDEVCVL